MDRGGGGTGRWSGVCALFSLVLGVVAASGEAAPRTVYTTQGSSDGVLAYEVLPSGALSVVAGSPVATGRRPTAVVATPDGRHLYIANQFDNDISAYAIGPDGGLEPIPGSPFPAGNAPVALAAAPDGRHLYAGNLGSESISVFGIGADGRLTQVPGSPFAVGFEPYALAIAPDGHNLYAGSTSIPSWEVRGFEVEADASLTELPGSPYPLPGLGGQTLDVTITPDGRNVYTGIGNNDVVGHSRAADGELTLDPGGPYEADFWGIAASPDGRFVYSADRHASDRISGFAVGTDGSLTALPGSSYAVTPPPSRPVAIAFTPDSRHLYASSGAPAFQNYGLSVAADGSLTPLPGSPFASGGGSESHSIVVSPNQGPTAQFTASVAPDGRIEFDASASSDPDGTVARYDWDFGDGTTLADGGPTPSHGYDGAGTYEVTLSVTDDEGCSTTVVYTGETASCNGSSRAQRTEAVTYDPAPVITNLRVQPKSFKAGRRATVLNKRGTRIRFGLSEDARVRFRIRRAPARLSNGKPKHPHVFRRQLTAGANAVPFTAKLGKRTFEPGRYQVIARARDAAGQASQRVRAKFKVKR